MLPKPEHVAVPVPSSMDLEYLLRVLYDPIGYYPPWAKAADRLRPRQRSALNAWLGQHFALPAYREPAASEAGLTRRLLLGWERIPTVAHLMACAKQRRRLVGSRLYLAQPSHVHAFLRLPFAPAQVDVPIQENADLLGWGGRYMVRGLQGRVPAWLLARMALQLTVSAGLTTAPAGGDEAMDLNCFWSAWNHAACLPR